MMYRTTFCLTLLVGLIASSTLRGADRPNILFIFADDQCFQTVGAFHDEIETPNLDRLVRRGTTFSHAYNMGSWSGAVCVASRTMLNTGRSVWNARRVWDRSEQERREGRWWSELMKRGGYRTYMTGKWHCKASAEAAFDVAKDIRPGMPRDTKAGYNRPQGPDDDSWSPSDPKFGGFWEGGTHWSEVVSDHATDFLADAKQRDDPFFMYLAFNAPHDPRQSPAEYVERYPTDEIQVPANFLPIYPYANEIGCSPSLRDERLAPFPRTEYAIRVHRQEYFAIITHMDEMIGRILDALEASGKAENTWIFFTADHGLAVGQHGLLGKQNLYDHSVRVPFTVVGPGVEAEVVNDQPIYLQDVMPTTLELAGIEKPEYVDFHSVLPVMDGEKSRYDSIYGAYLNKQRSIRTDRYKLIVYPDAGVRRLYDVHDDPHEMNDLAGDPSLVPVIEELFAKLQDQQSSLGDELDLTPWAP